MKPVDKWIVITAIVCLSVMEIFAMFNGIDGTMRTIIFTIIAALTGLSLPELKFGRKE